MKIFEKFAALIFLLLLIGLIGFLTFVPLPNESEKPVLMVIGGLMTAATTALPRLFGGTDLEKDRMRDRIRAMETEIAILRESYSVLRGEYDRLTTELLRHHVLADTTGVLDKSSVSEKDGNSKSTLI